MELSVRKEQFSYAWVRAIASVAGFAVDKPGVDDDSVDLTIASKSHMRPRLEVQVKCTADDDGNGDMLSFPLKIKNYDDLRSTELLVPRLLFVLRVPEASAEWLVSGSDEIVLRHMAWWFDLRGWPASRNAVSVTLGIPRAQRLTPESLARIMGQIASRQPITT